MTSGPRAKPHPQLQTARAQIKTWASCGGRRLCTNPDQSSKLRSPIWSGGICAAAGAQFGIPYSILGIPYSILGQAPGPSWSQPTTHPPPRPTPAPPSTSPRARARGPGPRPTPGARPPPSMCPRSRARGPGSRPTCRGCRKGLGSPCGLFCIPSQQPIPGCIPGRLHHGDTLKQYQQIFNRAAKNVNNAKQRPDIAAGAARQGAKPETDTTPRAH